MVEESRDELMRRARASYKAQHPELTWEQVNDLWPDLADPGSDADPMGRFALKGADPASVGEGEDPASVEPGPGAAAEGDAPPATGDGAEATPPDADEPVRPAQHALKEEWIAYAVSQGMSEEDAAAMTKDELIAEYAD